MYSKCYRVIYKLSSVTVKFRRILEEILDKMVKYGIAETKSEVIRVAGGACW
jgi:Arc/MetJ-type ribon-helix-helix transcriptional regulator